MIIPSPTPRRAGTSECESFSSYLHRTAELLNVSTTILINRLLRPKVDAITGRTSKKTTLAPVVDSLSATVEPWVSAMEELTGRKDLSQMTLWGSSRIFADAQIVRRCYFWCPYCLEEYANEILPEENSIEQTAFSPLKWRIPGYSVCIWHETKMQRHCQYCGFNQIAILWAGGRPGCCSRCRRWLGQQRKEEESMVDINELAQSVCIAECIELSYLGDEEIDAVRLFFHDVFSEGIGSVTALAKILGMHRNSYRTRCSSKNSVLTITDCCRIAQVAHRGVGELMARRPFPADLGMRVAEAASRASAGRPRQERHDEILSLVRSFVEREERSGSTLTMLAIARQTDLDFRLLSRIDAGSIVKIVRSLSKSRAEPASARDRLCAAMDDIIAAGDFPSVPRLAKKGVYIVTRPLYQVFVEERLRRGLPLGIYQNREAARSALEGERARIAERRNEG